MRNAELLRRATERLVAAAKGGNPPQALRGLAQREIDADLMTTGDDLRGRRRKVPAQVLVEDLLRPLINAEGSALFEGLESEDWVPRVCDKMDFAESIYFLYYSEHEMEGEAEIDRSDSRWLRLTRRSVTVPDGLTFEAAAVAENLKDAGVRISFSGLIDVALRELLSRPISTFDARRTDNEPTIADAIAKHGVAARRKAKSTS